MSSKSKPIVIGGCLLLLTLPLIMSSQESSNSSKDDFFSVRMGDFSDSPNQNPFDRYINRLKRFYNLGDSSNKHNGNVGKLTQQEPAEPPMLLAKAKMKNTNMGKKPTSTTATATTAAQNARVGENGGSASSYSADDNMNEYVNNNSFNNTFDIPEEADLRFSADASAPADFSLVDVTNYESNDYRENSVNLAEGTVLTTDNLLLQPTQEGYFYNGKFFKNGNYPRFANRKYIEGALNRYHSQVAGKLGKKAMYSKDNTGNLTVNYVDQLPNRENKFNFNQNSQAGNTFLASNKFRDSFNRYNGAHINGKNNMIGLDVAEASLQDMHSAYDLLQSQINNGTLTSAYKINIPENNNNSSSNNSNNSPLGELLKNAGTTNLNITDNPLIHKTPIPAGNDSETLTLVMGGKDFADDYAYGVHDLGCGTGEIFSFDEVATYNIRERMISDPLINIVLGTCAEPLTITPSQNIGGNIAENADVQALRANITNAVKTSDKTIVKVVSTDRNTAPMIDTINEGQSILNKDGKPVTLVAVGPQEGVRDLSTAMSEITNSVVEEQDKAQELNNTISKFYLTTQLKPTNTILAFPAAEGEAFVINDPNNYYWIRTPNEINKYDKMYLIKDGVYYQGAMIGERDIMNILNKERTNFLLVSDQEAQRKLENGSVLITVKESDINMNSYEPEAILRNTGLVQRVTRIGDKPRPTPKKRKSKASSAAATSIMGARHSERPITFPL